MLVRISRVFAEAVTYGNYVVTYSWLTLPAPRGRQTIKILMTVISVEWDNGNCVL